MTPTRVLKRHRGNRFAKILYLVAFITAACAEPEPIVYQASFHLNPDLNRDGTISFEEATQAQRIVFERLDQNEDGTLSILEIENSLAGDSRFHGKAFARSLTQWFRMTDSNEDHFVSLAEYQEAEQRMFRQVDQNGDGVITTNEMGVYRQ